MADRQGISVLVNTLNEEANLPFALRSLRDWVDEIVVVDMHSTDRTVAIAESFGARVFMHERLEFSEPARAFGAAQAGHDWLLILDADELITPALALRLRELVERDEHDMFLIPRLNYLFGAAMRASGWGPHQAPQYRLFRRSSVQLTGTIHDYIKLKPGARVFRLPYEPGICIVHFNYTSVRMFLDKMNRYTSIEADQALERGRRPTLARLVGRPVREFWRLWVRARGWRDGWRGLYLSVLMAVYRFLETAKLRERLEAGTENEIVSRYREVAERWLAGEIPDGTP